MKLALQGIRLGAGKPSQDFERIRMRPSGRLFWTALFLSPTILRAQAPPAPPPPWSGEASLSYVQTTGNSESQSFGAGLKLLYQSAPWKAEFTSAFIRTEADGAETARRFSGALRGERAFGDHLAAYAQGSYLRNLFAGIRGQEIAEAGGLYKFLTGPQHLLAASAGLAYTREQRTPPADDRSFLGASVGLSYHWKLSPTSEFAEELNYLPNFKDASDWRSNATTSLTASVTKVLAVKLAHQLSYMRSPVPGKKRTDTTLLASIVAKL